MANMLQEWGLTVANIGFIVVDGGANMLAAVSKYTDEHDEDPDDGDSINDDTAEIEIGGFLLEFLSTQNLHRFCRASNNSAIKVHNSFRCSLSEGGRRTDRNERRRHRDCADSISTTYCTKGGYLCVKRHYLCADN